MSTYEHIRKRACELVLNGMSDDPIYINGFNQGYKEGLARKITAMEHFQAGLIQDWEIAYAVEAQIHGFDLYKGDGIVEDRYRAGYVRGTYAVSEEI